MHCCCKSKRPPASPKLGGDSWELDEESQHELEVDLADHNYEWDSLFFAPKAFGFCGHDDEVSEEEEDEEDGSSPSALFGSWKCVDTWGLEEFLKATGIGLMQRKLALQARWPAWEFDSIDDGNILFVNHTQLGTMEETMILGKEYTWKDGHGNKLQCRTQWCPGAHGGTLRTTRSGQIGSYVEERSVNGSKLKFTLKHQTGVSWGRTFTRE